MNSMEEAAQDIINGKRQLRAIRAIPKGCLWDYKKDYNGRRALIRRNGGVTIAIAGMRTPQRECDEFYVALKIINKVQDLVDKGSSKP